ncbi:MAG: cell division protein FtsL [Methylococcaceae bacterium]
MNSELTKLGGLLLLLLISAMVVVYNKNKSRILFAEIQRGGAQLDEQEVEWGKIQLELNTLGEHHRIEKKATSALQMKTPKQEDIVFLKP